MRGFIIGNSFSSSTLQDMEMDKERLLIYQKACS